MLKAQSGSFMPACYLNSGDLAPGGDSTPPLVLRLYSWENTILYGNLAYSGDLHPHVSPLFAGQLHRGQEGSKRAASTGGEGGQSSGSERGRELCR